MAITSGYFNSVNGDRKYNADQMSEYFEGIINEGVCQHIDGGLAVTAGTGLSVNVAAGKAFIGKKWIRNDASLTLTISAASASYARIDAVVLRRNNTTRTCQIVVKSGTPAASPVAPTMTRNSTTYEMALAYVNVAANATSVTVTDKRADTTVCGWATVAESVPGEIDAQLNAMKTGFDGVVYDSPGAAVRACDQILQDQIDDCGTIKGTAELASTHPGVISSSGSISNPTANAEVYTDPIYGVIKGNLTITFSSSQQLWLAVAFYDANMKFISRTIVIASSGQESKSGSFTSPANARFIRLNYRTFGTTATLDTKFIGSVELVGNQEVADNKSNKTLTVNQYKQKYRSVNHRGWNTEAPENTLPAFALSKQHGFEYVECDIRFTSDGVPVVIHDASIDRTSDGEGDVVDFTYSQLLQYDFGSWMGTEWEGVKIPTFDQFVELCRNLNLKFYVELKTSLTSTEAQTVVNILKKYNKSCDCTFIASGIGWWQEIKAIDSNFRFGFVGSGSSYSSRVTEMVNQQALGFVNFLDWKYTDITSQMITDVLAAGLELEAWTVDSDSVIRSLDKNISGYTSNSVTSDAAWMTYYINNR